MVSGRPAGGADTPPAGRQTPDEIREYLASAPPELRGWAQEQLNKLDDADHAASHSEPSQPPATGAPDVSASDPDEPGIADSTDAIAARALDAGILEENDLALAELDEVADEQRRAVRKAHKKARRQPTAKVETRRDGQEAYSSAGGTESAAPASKDDQPPSPDPVAASVASEQRSQSKKSRWFTILVVAALVFGIAFGVFMIGAEDTDPIADSDLPEGHPDISEMSEMSSGDVRPPDHSQRIFELETALSSSPDDWEARLELGVLRMNQGDYAEAEEEWLRVLDGENGLVEAYYNLGFLYVAMTPPQHDKALEAWENLFELAPESDLAQDAQRFYDAVKAGPPAGTTDPSSGPTVVPTPDDAEETSE